MSSERRKLSTPSRRLTPEDRGRARLVGPFVGIVVLGMLAGYSASCSRSVCDVVRKPVEVFDLPSSWSSDDRRTQRGFFTDVRGGDGECEAMVRWTWDGGTLRREENVAPEPYIYIALTADLILTRSPGRERDVDVIRLIRIRSGEVRGSWVVKGDSHFELGSSRNGKYAAVMIESRTGDFRKDHYKLGVIDVDAGTIEWVLESTEWSGLCPFVGVSDDGRFVLAGQIRGPGVRMIDVREKRILWNARPPDVVSMRKVLFSSDGSVIYVADHGGGCVYKMDAMTGRVLDHWYATRRGVSVYGERIACMALSPDGAWLAAGTLGEVFMFTTTTPGTRPIVYRHREQPGPVLVVSFSPDSRHLASMKERQIKIWEVPASAGTP